MDAATNIGGVGDGADAALGGNKGTEGTSMKPTDLPEIFHRKDEPPAEALKLLATILADGRPSKAHLAEVCGCHRRTVAKWFNRHGSVLRVLEVARCDWEDAAETLRQEKREERKEERRAKRAVILARLKEKGDELLRDYAAMDAIELRRRLNEMAEIKATKV